MATPAVSLAPHVTPVETMTRLAAALGPESPRLLVKRDDLLSFACGGNKVRKLQTVAAEANAAGANALITSGGVQSNHARVTAAAGAALGMKVVLVVNGAQPQHPTANAKLDRLFGAEIRHVATREERAPAVEQAAAELFAAGMRPFVVPIGASTATGAMGYALAIGELVTAGVRPDVIIHASSSGGTQAGLVAGGAVLGLKARVIGVSADESSADLSEIVRRLLADMAARLGAKPETIGRTRDIEVDDTQVGDGYGIPTAASTEALELAARREGMLLDPVYTAKAMAGLIARVRAGAFERNSTVLFWHTGGQVGYFA